MAARYSFARDGGATSIDGVAGCCGSDSSIKETSARSVAPLDADSADGDGALLTEPAAGETGRFPGNAMLVAEVGSGMALACASAKVEFLEGDKGSAVWDRLDGTGLNDAFEGVCV